MAIRIEYEESKLIIVVATTLGLRRRWSAAGYEVAIQLREITP